MQKLQEKLFGGTSQALHNHIYPRNKGDHRRSKLSGKFGCNPDCYYYSPLIGEEFEHPNISGFYTSSPGSTLTGESVFSFLYI